MFGGEDWNRRLLNDVNVLDLETMLWTAVETMYVLYSKQIDGKTCSLEEFSPLCTFDRQAPPTPRFDHAAELHSERYLFIFGGCSHSVFFNDLHVLDLEAVSVSPFFLINPGC